MALLARAMTYKYAALGVQMGGAKAGVRGEPPSPLYAPEG
jgi:glutamate dehydrogenase/leucine dehydrogenase